MTTAIATNGAAQIDDKALLTLVSDGDCGRLTDVQKLAYYRARCDAAGLDYRAQPFQFVKLNNKLVLYALKACSDQLAAKHGIKTQIIGQETTPEGIRLVTVRAATRDGRETDEIGAVTVKGLSGDALANALMKAATKAKRRAVLSVCGLGVLDETEIETIPRAQPVKVIVHDDEQTTDETLEADLRASVQRSQAAGEPPTEADKETTPMPPSSPASNGKSAGAVAHDLILGIQKIANEHHYKKWWGAHEKEWQTLPPPLRKAVQTAYDNWAPGP